MHVREHWHNTFKVIKGKHLLPRMLYPTKLSLRFEREIKNFTDTRKLHCSSFTGKHRGTSLSGERKKKTTTGNMKITKGKISLVKANI